jgi:hypothetical protein
VKEYRAQSVEKRQLLGKKMRTMRNKDENDAQAGVNIDVSWGRRTCSAVVVRSKLM